MPKNKGKGGKNRRRGKNENEETKRQLEFKEPGQEYSQVVRMLGNGRCECYCFDGVTRLGHIRGKMRKKVSLSATLDHLRLASLRRLPELRGETWEWPRVGDPGTPDLERRASRLKSPSPHPTHSIWPKSPIAMWARRRMRVFL